jgi:hypothetical protein
MDKEIAPSFEKWVEGIKTNITSYSIKELNELLKFAKNGSYFGQYDELISVIENEINAR